LGLFCNFTRREFLERSLGVGALACGVCPPATKRTYSIQKQKVIGPWKIGCYTRPWDQYDYREALDAIAEAGYPYVGLMTTKSKSRLVISVETTAAEAAQVGEEVKKRKLEVLSVYGGGIPVAKSLAAGIEGLKRLIDNCAACGAKNLMMGGVGNKDLYGPYYKAVAECCDYAATKRMGISVKPHGGLNATGPQCRKTVEMVGHKNFRIWYDPANIYYYSDAKLNPIQDAGTVDGLVIGMCIKDYRHPKQVMLTPGTGQVDFEKVMARLIQGGFTKGPLIVECLEKGKGDKKKLLAEAKKAREFIEELVSQKAKRIVKNNKDIAHPQTLSDQQWPQVRQGHYVQWLDRAWNTRKPAKIWQVGEVGILGQHNGTATYLGEDKVNAGTVEFDVKFDRGYLAPEGGGKHFLEIMSWVADRSDRQAIGERPWSRIELARLGDRPRCYVWNYGSHFEGRATKFFSVGPAFEPDRWRHIKFAWSYQAPIGKITFHIDDQVYTNSFEFVPGTIGPGRFYLFGHVETVQPDGCLYFRNFKVSRQDSV